MRLFTQAVASIFNEEWNNLKDFVLSKSIGFGALVKLFPSVYERGIASNNLSEPFFTSVFEVVRSNFRKQQIEINQSRYGLNEQSISKLAADMEACFSANPT